MGFLREASWNITVSKPQSGAIVSPGKHYILSFDISVYAVQNKDECGRDCASIGRSKQASEDIREHNPQPVTRMNADVYVKMRRSSGRPKYVAQSTWAVGSLDVIMFERVCVSMRVVGYAERTSVVIIYMPKE